VERLVGRNLKKAEEERGPVIIKLVCSQDFPRTIPHVLATFGVHTSFGQSHPVTPWASNFEPHEDRWNQSVLLEGSKSCIRGRRFIYGIDYYYSLKVDLVGVSTTRYQATSNASAGMNALRRFVLNRTAKRGCLVSSPLKQLLLPRHS